MIPRLRRFYGGSLEEYLSMPIMWLRAHAEAIQELQARESILETMLISVAMGRMKKADSQKVTSEWLRQAGAVAAVRPKTRADLINALRGMGVG